jgi:hypothetical protein
MFLAISMPSLSTETAAKIAALTPSLLWCSYFTKVVNTREMIERAPAPGGGLHG